MSANEYPPAVERITLEGAAAMARSTNPLADAITVLKHVANENPPERPDTEDAQNRVALAIGYLRMADEIMRSLAKDNYVQGVIVKLGEYDRCELIEARKVIAAVDAYCEDSTPETRLALHVAAENFAMALPALQGRAEP
ncbi:MAG: hypothetical protein KGL39_24990 [Patescibacteria group bacterium]|nr:hypothetical protein [Patescibacteria group bacterium]